MRGMGSFLRSDDEGGAVLVMYALFIFVIFGLVAITIDLGALKFDRRNSQTVADLSATAGALDLDAASGTYKAQNACQTAWGYFLTNSGEASLTNNCGNFPAAAACPTTSQMETNTTASYSVQITWPVLNGDALMQGRSGEAFDGDPCERLGVWITRTRGFIFAPVIGGTQGSTGAPAVARAVVGSKDEQVANLMLLDKTDCNTLSAGGGGGVRVVAAKNDEGEWNPGRIHADSNGSACSGSSYVIDVNGGGSILAEGDDASPPAKGVIELVAQPAGASTCQGYACNPSKILSSYSSTAPGIWPQPTNLTKQTNRTVADHRYNCNTDYSYLNGQAPLVTNWNVPGCTDGTQPYIDTLKSQIGTGSTNPSPYDAVANPSGFKNFKPTYSCNVNSPVVVPAGNWYVNCNSLDVKDSITFLGGNIIFQDDVTISNGGTLTVNPSNPIATLASSCLESICIRDSSATASFLYFAAGGDLSQSNGGALNLNNTFAYLRDGAVKITGGSFTWVAPTEGPFEDLALWSDRTPPNNSKPDENSLVGQGTTTMEGVYFTPNSLTKIAGGGGSQPKKAQFFTWDMNVTGGGALLLKPDPNRNLPVPVNAGVRLIR